MHFYGLQEVLVAYIQIFTLFWKLNQRTRYSHYRIRTTQLFI